MIRKANTFITVSVIMAVSVVLLFSACTGEEEYPDALPEAVTENPHEQIESADGGSCVEDFTKSDDRYENHKADLSIPVEDILDGLLTYPYVEGIETEEDYKTVTILVDNAIFGREGISSGEDLISLYSLPMLGSYINVYRMLAGLDDEFSIIIEDSHTGMEFDKIDYPLK